MFSLNKSFTAIDIGTNKICAAVAKVQKQTIKIVNTYYQLSTGITFGNINDINALEYSILNTLNNLEKSTQKQIKSITVSLPNWVFYSEDIKRDVVVNGQITNEHITNLVSDLDNNIGNKSFILQYKIDEEPVNNPIGMIGNTLSVKVNRLVIDSPFFNIISNFFIKRNIKINHVMCSLYSSYLSLHAQNSHLTVVDFGWSSVTVSIIDNGNIKSIYVLPIGSRYITQDISNVLNVDYNEAEKLKILYGITDNFAINDQFQINDDSMSVHVLYDIISARVSEIFYLVKEYLNQNVNEIYYKNIVLTGGGSCMMGLLEYIHDIFVGSTVTIGMPQMIIGQNDFTRSSAFSATAGAILCASQNSCNLQKKNLKRFLSVFRK